MSKTIFEVQIIDRESGNERWAKVAAISEQEAISKVTQLGCIVGECRLAYLNASEIKSQASDNTSSGATGATILSFCGLFPIFGLGIVFALAGLIWGSIIAKKTSGKKGVLAIVVGSIMTFIWVSAFLVVLVNLR